VFELMAAEHFFFCPMMLGRPRSSIEPPAGVSLTRLFGTEFLLSAHVVA
jgi:hypothetical protein